MTVDRYTGEVLPATSHPRRPIDDWTDVLSQVVDLATNLAATEFVPTGLRGSVPKTTAAILYGRELDLPPMTALSSIHVVNGRPGTSAELQRAQILAAGHQFRITRQDMDRCTVRGRRREDRDDPDAWQEFTFTSAEAQQAGLLGKDVWKNYRPDMLLARATTRCARAMFSDVTRGLASVEELDDLTAPVPVAVTVEAPRTIRAKKAATAAIAPAPLVRTPAVNTAEPVMTAHDPQTSGEADQRPASPQRESALAEFKAAVDERVAEAEAEAVEVPSTSRSNKVTREQQGTIMAHCRRLELVDPERLQLLALLRGQVSPAGKVVMLESTSDLTRMDASRIIDQLALMDSVDELRAKTADMIAAIKRSRADQ